jgi:predicted O-methyltransferase YrrM
MDRMIPDSQGYFRKFIPKRDAALLEIEGEAERHGVHIVGPVVGELLYILTRLSGAKAVLELGCATGYSAIHLAKACRENGGHLITVEQNKERAAQAENNFRRAGVQDLVEIRLGSALDLMTTMQGSFDLIFLDIHTQDYATALPLCRRLLKIGGLLVTDNVGFAGADAFNTALFASSEWRSVSLFCLLPRHSPENDGLSLALRIA